MTMAKKEEQIFVGVDNAVIELVGKEKEDFIAEREARNERYKVAELEMKAKQEARLSALQKLSDIAGLTAEELNAIL